MNSLSQSQDPNKAKITISINSYRQIIPSKFAEKAYTVYLVECKDINTAVYRRFRDFDWLRRNLTKYYPDIFVPGLPEKSVFSELINHSTFVNNRMQQLKFFLDHLIDNRFIRNSLLLEEFLTEKNLDEFERKKNNYDAYSPSSTSYILKNNTDNLTDLKDNEHRIGALRNVLTRNLELVSHLKNEFVEIEYELRAVSNRLLAISTLFNHISNQEKNNQDFFEKTEIDTYCRFNEFFLRLQKSFAHQTEFFNVNFQNVYASVANEYSAFINMIDNFNSTKDRYYDSLSNLNQKKDKCYKTRNYADWDMNAHDILNIENIINNSEVCKGKMFKTETAQTDLFNAEYIHLSRKVNKEYNRLKTYLSQFIQEKFNTLSSSNQSVLSNIFSLVELLSKK